MRCLSCNGRAAEAYLLSDGFAQMLEVLFLYCVLDLLAGKSLHVWGYFRFLVATSLQVLHYVLCTCGPESTAYIIVVPLVYRCTSMPSCFFWIVQINQRQPLENACAVARLTIITTTTIHSNNGGVSANLAQLSHDLCLTPPPCIAFVSPFYLCLQVRLIQGVLLYWKSLCEIRCRVGRDV